MAKYRYIGSGEVLVPFTLHGPRVVDGGDVVEFPPDVEPGPGQWEAAGDGDLLCGRVDFTRPEPVEATPIPGAPAEAPQETAQPSPQSSGEESPAVPPIPDPQPSQDGPEGDQKVSD